MQSLDKEKINHTLALYSLSKVDAYGEISLDSESGAIHIRFPREDCKEHVDNTLRKLKEISKILGGRLVTSLPWTEYQDILTVHPSGGCCMGLTGVDGVVNHKGQVFIGMELFAYIIIIFMLTEFPVPFHHFGFPFITVYP